MEVAFSLAVKVTAIDDDICLIQYQDPDQPLQPQNLESAKRLIRSEGQHRHVALVYECPEWVKALTYNYFDVVACHHAGSTFTVQMTNTPKYLFEEAITISPGMLPENTAARVGSVRR